MMCGRYKKLLIPYLEGGIDEGVRRKVEEHLAGCDSCARELAMVRSVSGVLRAVDAPAVEPATDLWARVSARIEAENQKPAPRQWLRATQAASACVATLLFVAIGIGMFLPNEPAPEPSSPPTVVSEPAPEPEAPRSDMNLYAANPPAPAKAARPAAKKTSTPKASPAEPTRSRPAPPRSYGLWYAKRGSKQPAPEARNEDYAWNDSSDRPKTSNGTSLNWSYKRAERMRSAEAARRGVAANSTASLATKSAEPAPVVAGAGLPTERVTSGDRFSPDADADTVSAGVAAARSPASLGLSMAAAPTASAAAWGNAVGGLADAGSAGANTVCGRPAMVVADRIAETESAVEMLNETEGVRVVALFAYP